MKKLIFFVFVLSSCAKKEIPVSIINGVYGASETLATMNVNTVYISFDFPCSTASISDLSFEFIDNKMSKKGIYKIQRGIIPADYDMAKDIKEANFDFKRSGDVLNIEITDAKDKTIYGKHAFTLNKEVKVPKCQ